MQINLTWPDGIPVTHIDVPFLQGMLDRMATSYFKYGSMRNPTWNVKTDMFRNLLLRWAEYQNTANTEFLMDVANFAMIEFVNPTVQGAHFRATEGAESPGLYSKETGEMTHELRAEEG